MTVVRPARRAVAVLVAVVVLAGPACVTPQTEAADDEVERTVTVGAARAFRDGAPSLTVVQPVDGAVVTSPVRIDVTTENLRLSPAGRTRDGEGHLHVLIDRGCMAPGVVIPEGRWAIDVDDGSSAVLADLPPGLHELCVQVGDGFHVAVGVFERVRIEVAPWPTGPVSVGEHPVIDALPAPPGRASR